MTKELASDPILMTKLSTKQSEEMLSSIVYTPLENLEHSAKDLMEAISLTRQSIQNNLLAIERFQPTSIYSALDDISKRLDAMEKRLSALESTKGGGCKANTVTKQDDDDGFELFGSDDDDTASKKEKEKPVEQKKPEGKKKKLEKSLIVMDVKPLDDETKMDELESLVRNISIDGLVWGSSELVPVAYGIMKLRIAMVIEDEKVSLDDLENAIHALSDHVQSTDVVSFNRTD